MKHKLELNAVSQTLLITLYMRHLDNIDPNSLLKDHHSSQILEQIDFDSSKFDEADISKTGVIVRSKLLDDEIISFCARHKHIIIVQLGAGLDTRALRLKDICANAVFYDLDLPEVIGYRDLFMAKASTTIGASILEVWWMDMLADKYPNYHFIFVLEGVSMYLEKEQLQWLFSNLSQRFCGVILLDLVNVFFTKYAAKNHDVLKNMDAQVKFGTNEPLEIESWGENIKLIKKTVMFDEFKNRWSFKARIMSLVPTFKNACNLFTYAIGVALADKA